MRRRQSHLAVLAVWVAVALAFWGQPAGAQNVSVSPSLSLDVLTPSMPVTITHSLLPSHPTLLPCISLYIVVWQ